MYLKILNNVRVLNDVSFHKATRARIQPQSVPALPPATSPSSQAFLPKSESTGSEKMSKQKVITLDEALLQKLKSSFTIFDDDGDGTITPQELGTVLREAGAQMEPKAVRELVKQVDYNGDGVLDFPEFATEIKIEFLNEPPGVHSKTARFRPKQPG